MWLRHQCGETHAHDGAHLDRREPETRSRGRGHRTTAARPGRTTLKGDIFSISALHLAIKVPYFSNSGHGNEKVTTLTPSECLAQLLDGAEQLQPVHPMVDVAWRMAALDQLPHQFARRLRECGGLAVLLRSDPQFIPIDPTGPQLVPIDPQFIPIHPNSSQFISIQPN
eukprot:SAG31_NODE_747_length_12395_cov_129.196405_2_plen_169_part_00